ncbi:MAG: beta-lactamase family protein [Candidatus Aminicenantes bacterium]|nr:MAG: beta-lactamase family protein [Candidatus Aminicenantes bacterium]
MFKKYRIEKPSLIVTIILSFCMILSSCTQAEKQEMPTEEIQRATSPSNIKLINALKTIIPHAMRYKGTPGLNIALARDGKVIWEAGFGYADLEKGIPMTPETVMHSGSMGKTYTATAIMQLAEKGVIGIDDSINKYLKEFQVTNPFGERDITFRDLLTHRSGLTSNAAGSEFKAPKPLGEHLKEGYTQKTFKTYKGTLLPRWSAKVGKRFLYSNFGMATLGYLVEVTNPEGLSFSEYVQKNIMDPLGMSSSMYPPVQDAAHVRSDIFERFSSGYAQFGAIDIPTPNIYFADYPAGTVVTTPGDHIRLLLAYLNKGTYNDYELLKPETVELMLTPQLDEALGGTVSLGLTWMLENIGKYDFNFGHSGAHMYGWMNTFRAFPKQDFAVAIATNHWAMQQNRYKEHRIIYSFISSWLRSEELFVEQKTPASNWAWKTSYVVGLIMAEQLKGYLGIEGPVTSEMIESMAVGAKLRADAPNSSSGWDPDGFRAGMRDMLDVEMTLKAIQSFIASDQIKVTPEELRKIYKELGGELPSVLFNWK